MTISRMAPSNQDTVGPVGESVKDELRIHPARTHQANDAGVWRILHARTSRQIRSKVSTPIAEERYDPGFKHRSGSFFTVRHGPTLLLSPQTPLHLQRNSG